MIFTFKIIKHVAGVGETLTLSAMYTVCNEYGEIKMQLLVRTKALRNLQDPYECLRRSYELHGHRQPEVVFSDNVAGDKNFPSSVLPSLCHIQASNNSNLLAG
jgi:hypothetical protein